MKKEKAKKEITLDDLAVMVQNGFSELRTELKSDLELMDEKIEEIRADVSDIKADLNKKADRFEYKDLEYRVEKLEKKCA